MKKKKPIYGQDWMARAYAFDVDRKKERSHAEILVKALEAIIHHQDYAGGNLAAFSTTRFIADKALREYRERIREKS